MLPVNFEAKRLSILACAKKNKSKTKCHPKMSCQFCFFYRRNTAAPFRTKIVKHACDTNTIIYNFFQNFLKTFYYFFRGTVHPEHMLPGAKTPLYMNTV